MTIELFEPLTVETEPRKPVQYRPDEPVPYVPTPVRVPFASNVPAVNSPWGDVTKETPRAYDPRPDGSTSGLGSIGPGRGVTQPLATPKGFESDSGKKPFVGASKKG